MQHHDALKTCIFRQRYSSPSIVRTYFFADTMHKSCASFRRICENFASAEIENVCRVAPTKEKSEGIFAKRNRRLPVSSFECHLFTQVFVPNPEKCWKMRSTRFETNTNVHMEHEKMEMSCNQSSRNGTLNENLRLPIMQTSKPSGRLAG